MARPLRLHVPGGFYHVTLRGNHRQAIFRTPEDRALLDSIVAEVSDQLGARVHAYCWMTNHIHALIQVADAPMGKIILRIASQYARRFQERIETTGHLFERRYHALLVDAEQYLLTLVRYIHRNPVRAGIASDPSDYAWSSHREYLGTRRTPWVHTAVALGMLAGNTHQARQAYMDWMGLPGPNWNEIQQEPHREHPQVLGDDRFLARARIASTACRKAETWDGLVAECASRFNLDAAEITSPSRSRRIAIARAWLSHEAVLRGVASISGVARQLRRSESAMRKLMTRHPRCGSQ